MVECLNSIIMDECKDIYANMFTHVAVVLKANDVWIIFFNIL
jgi:hypothetical protein